VIAFIQWFAQVPGNHYYVAEPGWPKKLPAKITVLDVGAGAAVHVWASRADWLLDCGSGRDYERVLRSYLHGAGINRITGLLLTHGDSLHLGGTENLLRDFVPHVLIDNSAETGAVELEFGEREWQARAYLTGEIFRSANR